MNPLETAWNWLLVRLFYVRTFTRTHWRRYVLRRCAGCPRRIGTGHKMDCSER